MKMLVIYSLIGLRNIRRNFRRSLLAVLAISFGLFCLIVFQALKVGLHREMMHSTLNLDPGTIQIHAKGYEANIAVLQPIEQHEELTAILAKDGFHPSAERLKTPALLLAGRKSSSVLLSGIRPEQEKQITFIGAKTVAGSYLKNPGTLFIGETLAASLEVGVGDSVMLMAQSMYGKPVTRRLPVGGIFRTKSASFDRNHIYTDLATAQSMLEASNVITEIALQTDHDAVESIAGKLRQRLNPELFQVRAWQVIIPDLKQLIELNDATMGLLVFIVFAIVAMGIANTMTTAIFERFREFGTMTAIGTTPGGIVTIVVLESFFLGLIAVLVGTLAGTIACTWLSRYGLDLSSFISSNQYFAEDHVLKAYLLPGDLLRAVFITLVTAVLAGIYPAWKASRLDPVKAIAHT